MKYLIVCGGKTDKEFGLNEIKTDGIDAIIAADSWWDFLYENGVTPDIIVGDFDSATTKSLEYFERKGQTEIHRLNPIKDDTDTEYAIRLAIREGARSIVLLGATGSRIDHVLGNISLLGQLSDVHQIEKDVIEEMKDIEIKHFGEKKSSVRIDITV